MSGDGREMISAFFEDAGDIASADTAGLDFEQDLTLAPYGIGNFFVTKIAHSV